MQLQVMAARDVRWLVTACWDGHTRRIRFRCRDKAEAINWCAWVLAHESETAPEICSLRDWEAFINE